MEVNNLAFIVVLSFLLLFYLSLTSKQPVQAAEETDFDENQFIVDH